MKIAVVSDTHGGTAMWERALPHINGADMLLHAGDILYHGARNPLPERYDPGRLGEMLRSLRMPVHYAKGNCDSDVDLTVLDIPFISPYFIFKIESLSVLLTHGDRHDREGLYSLGRKMKADIVISGHTHLPLLERNEGVTLLNPGSLGLARGDFSGTVAVIDDSFSSTEIAVIEVESGRQVMTQSFFK